MENKILEKPGKFVSPKMWEPWNNINCFIWTVYFQEKKQAEQIKPEDRAAQKREHEYQKMEKLLTMVRQVYKDKK